MRYLTFIPSTIRTFVHPRKRSPTLKETVNYPLKTGLNAKVSVKSEYVFSPLYIISDPFETNCLLFQVTFQYGREQPFPNNPYCHGGITCTITETQTASWTTQLNINPAVKGDVMSIGTTGSLSYGSSWAQARAYSVNPGKDPEGNPICGYFTFLPITKGVW